jgi:hypothetical protein
MTVGTILPLAATQQLSADELQRLGPSIQVLAGFDPAFDWRRLGTMPTLPAVEWPALIDTGASRDAIDAALARDLSLPTIGKTTQQGIGGERRFDICRAHIIFPQFNIGVERLMLIAELRSAPIIFGRPTLRNFRLVYDGASGFTSLTLSP